MSIPLPLKRGERIYESLYYAKVFCQFFNPHPNPALVINPSFLRKQESRVLALAMDSGIRRNDGDGFVTKALRHYHLVKPQRGVFIRARGNAPGKGIFKP